VVREYDGYAVLDDDSRQSTIYSQLKSRLASLKSEITGSLDNLFERYSLVDSPAFFAQFPIKSEFVTYLDGKAELWRSKTANLTSSQLISIFASYKPWLNSELKREMGVQYFDTFLSDYSDGDGIDSFGAIMAAVNATRAAEMPLEKIPGTKVALIEVTSRTLLEKG